MSGRKGKRGLPSGLTLVIELLILAGVFGMLVLSRGSFLKGENGQASTKKEAKVKGDGEADQKEEESTDGETDQEKKESSKEAEFEPVPTPKMDPVKVQDASGWMAAAPVSEGDDQANMVSVGDNWQVAVPLEQGTVGDSKKTEEAEETQKKSSSLKKASILVVNGTYKNGVASYWEGVLKAEGYKKLTTGNNNSAAQEVTVIYASDPDKAQELTAFFPGAQVVEGKVPSTVTLGDGSAPGEDYDACIVVGTGDAENL